MAFNQQGLGPGLDGPQGPVSTGTVHTAPPAAPNWPPLHQGPPSPFPIQNPTGYPGGWKQGAAHGSVGGGWGGDAAWHGVVDTERGSMQTRTAGGGQPTNNPPNFSSDGMNATVAQPAQSGSHSPAALANAVRAAGAAQQQA